MPVWGKVGTETGLGAGQRLHPCEATGRNWSDLVSLSIPFSSLLGSCKCTLGACDLGAYNPCDR